VPNPTGPTNDTAKRMISELRRNKLADIAKQLAKPARQKKAVSVQRLAKLSRKADTFVVPGKVVGKATLEKGINVYAFSYSRSAREAINKSGKALYLRDFIKDKPKAWIVR